MNYLTLGSAKIVKGEALGFLSGILYLSPGSLGGSNLCPFSTNECRFVCFGGEHSSGRFAMEQARADRYGLEVARFKRTQAFRFERARFLSGLHSDIQALIRKAKREDFIPALRLNGTSDLAWWTIDPSLFEYPEVRYYEYTKRPPRFLGNKPAQVDMTYSYSGDESEALDALRLGFRVAVVFRPRVPSGSRLFGVPVIDGDESDLRFLDPGSVVVGLKAKGHAKRFGGSFVREVANAA